MSASALRSPELIRIAAEAAAKPEVVAPAARGWNAGDFAREQIRGLVRQLFFSSADRPVRQVVFSAVEAQDGVGDICRDVGEALAVETNGSVAVVTRLALPDREIEIYDEKVDPVIREKPQALRLLGTRVRRNLWLVGESEIAGSDQAMLRRTSLYSQMNELRREFEYSIVEGLPAAESSDAAALGQLADGVVLVLSATSTRRATARKMKETLDAAAARILGAVLSERSFPIPDRIYRRL